MEPDLCRGILVTINEAKREDLGLGKEGQLKSSLTYMVGCDLIVHVFVIEHIPLSEIELR